MGLADAIKGLFIRKTKEKLLDDEFLKDKIKKVITDTAEN
jgi:hypothetical protein